MPVHPWKRAWRNAKTAEERKHLKAVMQAAHVEAKRKLVEKLREHRDAVAANLCADCRRPLHSARRTVCPVCTLKRVQT